MLCFSDRLHAPHISLLLHCLSECYFFSAISSFFFSSCHMTFPLDSPAATFKLNKLFSKFHMVLKFTEEDPGQTHALISCRKVLMSRLGLSCCRARLCTKLPRKLGSSCPSQTEPTSSTSPPQGFLLFIQYQQFIFLFLSRSSFHNHNHIYVYV